MIRPLEPLENELQNPLIPQKKEELSLTDEQSKDLSDVLLRIKVTGRECSKKSDRFAPSL
jgi:hypothetical protein